MRKRTKETRKSGFTMVEIIAVLVIIGIMAAVAAPKFINMASDARSKAAVSGISEAMATLSVAYSKAYLDNDGVEPTIAQVMTAANWTSGDDQTFGDVIVTPTVVGSTVSIATVSVDGTAVDPVITKVWTKPTQ